MYGQIHLCSVTTRVAQSVERETFNLVVQGSKLNFRCPFSMSKFTKSPAWVCTYSFFGFVAMAVPLLSRVN